MAVARSVLVTGGNRGIGLELVKQLLAGNPAPEFIFATHRSPLGSEGTANLESLAKEHRALHLIQLDVTDEDGLKQAASTIQGVVGEQGLNLVINNSGLNQSSARHLTLPELTKDAMVDHFVVNTVAPVLLSQTMLPLLKQAAEKNGAQPLGSRRAAIVHVTSLLGSVQLSGEGRFQGVTNPARRMYAYRGSKCALNMYARVMSYELIPMGIVTLLVHPGWVRTDMGGPNGDLGVDESVRGILQQIAKLDESRNGAYVDHAGEVLPW